MQEPDGLVSGFCIPPTVLGDVNDFNSLYMFSSHFETNNARFFFTASFLTSAFAPSLANAGTSVRISPANT